MKPRLIILSDLWGIDNSDWIKTYSKNLIHIFEIKVYDCCKLGKIDTSICNQNVLHKQFLKDGIEIAAKCLLKLETDRVNILAFSIGGLIGWKAGLMGLEIDNFYAISSTRLRHEIEKPNGNIEVFFASKDKFKPPIAWFKRLQITNHLLENHNHETYKDQEVTKMVCDLLINAVSNKI